MKALRLTLILSLLALGTAHAAGDEPPQVETIVVTAKRPAAIETGETMLIVTVRAPSRIVPVLVPEVVVVSPEDSVVIEAPKADLAILKPNFESPKLSVAPTRIQLALLELPQSKG
jgi:hypothetical protein